MSGTNPDKSGQRDRSEGIIANELINGKRDFTIEYAMMIEAALGIDAECWIILQGAYNKCKVQRNPSFMKRLAGIRRIAAAL